MCYDNLTTVVGLSILGVLVTAALYGAFESFAFGKGKFLGATVKFGGALGGYVVVMAIILAIYQSLQRPETTVDIEGEWLMVLTRQDGTNSNGIARVWQESGRRSFSITGEVKTDRSPGFVTFKSELGQISGRRLVFVYENSRSEFGVAKADLTSDNPDRLTFFYSDVYGGDVSEEDKVDTHGRIEFTRK